MVCAKADLEIARMYVERLGADTALLARLEAEYARTVDALLQIRGSDHLVNDSDVLRAAITLRNPYVDALSLLQIALLRRKRARRRGRGESARGGGGGGDAERIAQGLRNTG